LEEFRRFFSSLKTLRTHIGLFLMFYRVSKPCQKYIIEYKIVIKTTKKEVLCICYYTLNHPLLKKSILDNHKDFLLDCLQNKLSAQLMYQKLFEEKGFLVSYCSVKRYVAKLRGPGFPYMPTITP